MKKQSKRPVGRPRKVDAKQLLTVRLAPEVIRYLSQVISRASVVEDAIKKQRDTGSIKMAILFDGTDELWWITARMDYADDQGVEYCSSIADSVADIISCEESSRNRKLDSYGELVSQMEYEQEIAMNEVQRWTAKVDCRRRRVAYLKSALKDAMVQQGLAKINTDKYQFSVIVDGTKSVEGMDEWPIKRNDLEDESPLVYIELHRRAKDHGARVAGVTESPTKTKLRIK